jgi:hypothetical protein
VKYAGNCTGVGCAQKFSVGLPVTGRRRSRRNGQSRAAGAPIRLAARLKVSARLCNASQLSTRSQANVRLWRCGAQSARDVVDPGRAVGGRRPGSDRAKGEADHPGRGEQPDGQDQVQPVRQLIVVGLETRAAMVQSAVTSRRPCRALPASGRAGPPDEQCSPLSRETRSRLVPAQDGPPVDRSSAPDRSAQALDGALLSHAIAWSRAIKRLDSVLSATSPARFGNPLFSKHICNLARDFQSPSHD